MYLEAIIIIPAKESHTRIDVATIYTLREYLHTDTYEGVIFISKGRLAELLVNIQLKFYREYVVIDKGVKVL